MLKEMITDINGHSIPIGFPETIINLDGSTVEDKSDPATSDCIIRVIAGSDTYIAFGENPEATNNSMLLAEGIPEYFLLLKGHRISVLGSIVNFAIFKTSK